MAREWPLVVFTVLSQLAVGSFLFVAGPLYVFGRVAAGETDRDLRLKVLLAVLGLLLIAVSLAFFHLRHPSRSFRILGNIRTSWLSREVFFVVILLGLLAGLAICEGLSVGSGTVRMGLALAAALAGVVFLFSMSMIYRLPSIPAWDRTFTTVSFLLTALATGSLASTWIFCLRSGAHPVLWRTNAAASLGFLLTVLFLTVLLSPDYGFLVTKEGPTLRPPGVRRPALYLWRVTLTAAGAVVLIMATLGEGRRPGSHPPASPALLAVLLLALAGETIGRFLFYGYMTGTGGLESRSGHGA